MRIVFPVLVLERDSGDVMRFNSVAEMQKQLERIDVENAEYLAWESGGCPIRISAQESLWLNLECDATGADTAGLFNALKKFAGSRGVQVDTGDQNTPPLALYERIIAQSPQAKGGVLGRLFKSRRG
jgi:hypothetical protein